MFGWFVGPQWLKVANGTEGTSSASPEHTQGEQPARLSLVSELVATSSAWYPPRQRAEARGFERSC